MHFASNRGWLSIVPYLISEGYPLSYPLSLTYFILLCHNTWCDKTTSLVKQNFNQSLFLTTNLFLKTYYLTQEIYFD